MLKRRRDDSPPLIGVIDATPWAYIGWFTDFNSGEVLDWRLLQQCGDLGIDLALDVYGQREISGD